MSWDSLVDMAQSTLISGLKDDSINYYRSIAPSVPIPVDMPYSKLQKDQDLGSIDVGTYQDAPHSLVKLSDLGFTPVRGDKVEARGETLEVYKVLLDGEGMAALFLGNVRP